MLFELTIQDLALIQEARLEFGPGLNVITGETGAGKSLLVGALDLLMGRRSRAGLVRKGAPKARVIGRFLLSEPGSLLEIDEFLKAHAPELVEEREEGAAELLLSRTVSAEGRSRCYVDGHPVTQKVLRELATLVCEVHGQNENQRLLEAAEQRRLLDAYGGLESKLAAYRGARTTWIHLHEKLERFEEHERERTERAELLRFQEQELAGAGLRPGEHEELLRTRERLRHAAELTDSLGGLATELGEGGAVDAVARAARVLGPWSERIEELGALADHAESAGAHLDEVVSGLAQFLEGLGPDAGNLQELEDRLYGLERLQRKHRCSAEELVGQLAEVRAALEEMEGDTVGREELEREAAAARDVLRDSARVLSRGRKQSAKKLRTAVQERLADLGLERAEFDVGLRPREEGAPGPDGAEEVVFLLAANPGEGGQPLRQVASGGEAARILLALRGALAVRHTIPTLVFDEVDAAVGGRLGPRVAEHLLALGRHHQVLCVTHLAPIAARADKHLRAEKEVLKGRTHTRVVELEGDRRVEELAEMIAGESKAASALAEARRLLAGS